MNPDRETIQDLATQSASHPVLVGSRVYEPLTFRPEVIKFTRKQYLFLHHFKLGVELEEAAAKADMTLEQVERFLAKEDTQAWLSDRALQDHIRNEWQEPSKWWAMGNEVLEGRRHLSKDQQVVFAMFGDRVCPKAKESSDSGAKNIVINIDPGAVQEAFRRQNAIDADIVQDKPL